ncbi:MAG: restriction endonuclease subunit S [Bacteroidales bacterium]|nr:restriction endonuclease subunit S [Bacteroidales bacterium]
MPFEIPESWEWTTLGDIGKWQAGGTPNRGYKEYFGGDIPWLKTGDLNDGYITEIPEFITQAGFENSSAKLNPKDSVLIALYGATIGKVGILTFPATTNQACCACIDYPAVDKLFLYYFLRQHRDVFISQGGGGAQPNISKEIIIATLIPIPPLAEQKRIVSEIEKWLDLIDELENAAVDLRDNIEQTQNKILDLAIHGKLVSQDPNDEPASDFLKRIAPDAKLCDTSHYGNLPSSWCVCHLGDIVNVINGKNQSKVVNPNGPYPIYGSGGIMGYADDYLCPENCTIIGRKGTINNPILVETKFWNVDTAFGMSPGEAINYRYFFYFCKSFDFTNLDKSTTLPSLTKTNIEQIEIPLPPSEEQERIVCKIEELFSLLEIITTQS